MKLCLFLLFLNFLLLKDCLSASCYHSVGLQAAASEYVPLFFLSVYLISYKWILVVCHVFFCVSLKVLVYQFSFPTALCIWCNSDLHGLVRSSPSPSPWSQHLTKKKVLLIQEAFLSFCCLEIHEHGLCILEEFQS